MAASGPKLAAMNVTQDASEQGGLAALVTCRGDRVSNEQVRALWHEPRPAGLIVLLVKA
jgi:hypothetical protein